MNSITKKIKNGWNVFFNNDTIDNNDKTNYYVGETYRPDKIKTYLSNERSIISSIYTRLAIDISSIDIRHVKVDENGNFSENVNSGLNNCLNLEANIDQTSRAFKQDMAMSLFENGVIAVVPVDTKLNPIKTEGYDILTLRVGQIVQWYPKHIKVNLYNDNTGKHEEIVLPKKMVAIIENPLYSVMNEPNSTLKRLSRKLSMLDTVDEKTNSGKLDLIIQLPYVIKSSTRKEQAEKRKSEIESQLMESRYGIAYTDGTEKITQLNRPVENNLLEQIKVLKSDLYDQLGLTEEVFKGVADEKTMINYFNRTIEAIVSAIALEFKRKFLTKTARSQGHSIEYYRDPFTLVPISSIADIADRFTRNEILTSNEVRSIIGYKPHLDPRADELRNKNMPLESDGYDSYNYEYGDNYEV